LVKVFLTENFVKFIPFTRSKFDQNCYPKLPFRFEFKNKQNGWIRSWFQKDVLIGQCPSKSVKVFRKIGWVSILSKSEVLGQNLYSGLHDHRTLSKKTLTKFLMENFDRVNGPLHCKRSNTSTEKFAERLPLTLRP